MGLAVNPDQQFSYVMLDHRDAPENERPTLRFRYLSARDFARVERLFDEARASSTYGDIITKVVEGVRVGLVGWENYPVAYNPDELDAVLSHADLVELRDELLQQMTVSQLEKKRSALQRRSTTAASVSNDKASA